MAHKGWKDYPRDGSIPIDFELGDKIVYRLDTESHGRAVGWGWVDYTNFVISFKDSLYPPIEYKVIKAGESSWIPKFLSDVNYEV